jgi:hypothetical protein
MNKYYWIGLVLVIAIILSILTIGFVYNKQTSSSLSSSDVNSKNLGLSKGQEENLNSKIEHTPSSETICNNGKCNLVLYSGIVNVYEDNKWKKVEDAKSLKGSGIDCVVNSDGENIAKCLDWNYTSVTLELSKDKNFGNTPIRVLIENETASKEKENKEFIEKKRDNYNFNSKEDKKQVLVKANIGDIIHFGENSTTITLQEANTQNLADVYTENYYGFYYTSDASQRLVFGRAQFIYNIQNIMFKFNISIIGLNNTNLIDSSLNLYSVYNAVNSTGYYNTTTYGMYNTSWNEGSLNWSNFSKAFYDNSSMYIWNNNTINNWNTINITNILSKAIGNNSITLYVNYTASVNAYQTIMFASKEYTNTSLRPYLNITYEAPTDIISPYFTNIANQTLAYLTSLSYDINASDETRLSGFIVNDTTNFKINFTSGLLENNTVLSGGLYWINITINDTSNNINSSVIYVNVTSKGFQSINPLLNGVNSNLTITYPQQFNVSYSGTNQTALTIKVDGVNIINAQNYTYGFGTYTINYSAPSNADYEAYNSLWKITINKNVGSCGILSNITSPQTYPILFNIYTNCTTDYTLYRNGTSITNNSIQGLKAGIYNFSIIRTDTANYSNTNYELDFTINKANSNLTMSISATTPITYGTITNFTGTGCPSQLTCSIDKANAIYGVGTTVFNYSTAGNENYTANFTTKTITINQATTSLGLTATTPITYGTATDFTGSGCPSGLTCNLNLTNSIFSARLISANYSFNGNTNYSGSSSVFTVTINKFTTILGISGTTPITVGTNTSVAGSGCPSQLSCNLSPANGNFSEGTYTFNYSTEGNENYTAYSITKDIIVQNASSPASISTALTSSCNVMTKAFSDLLPWLGIILFVVASGIVITIIILGCFEVNLISIILSVISIGFLTTITIIIIEVILGC